MPLLLSWFGTEIGSIILFDTQPENIFQNPKTEVLEEVKDDLEVKRKNVIQLLKNKKIAWEILEQIEKICLDNLNSWKKMTLYDQIHIFSQRHKANKFSKHIFWLSKPIFR